MRPHSSFPIHNQGVANACRVTNPSMKNDHVCTASLSHTIIQGNSPFILDRSGIPSENQGRRPSSRSGRISPHKAKNNEFKHILLFKISRFTTGLISSTILVYAKTARIAISCMQTSVIECHRNIAEMPRSPSWLISR